MEMKSLLIDDSDDDDSEVDIFETTNLLANNNKRGSVFESGRRSKRSNQRTMGNILKSLCCG